MKKITLILVILFAFVYANAQDYTVPRGLPYSDTRYVNYKAPQGVIKVDSFFMTLSHDTASKPLYPSFAYWQNTGIDSTLWVWDMLRWKKLGSSDNVGTVTSVGLTMPTGFSVANSPITSSGTLAVTTTLNGIIKGTGSGFGTIIVGSGLSYDGTTLTSTGSGGSVTTLSSGNLSPLFTTSVANPTTTPALTFSLTNAAGGTVFGNNTGSSAAPAYTSVPVLGIAGTTKGTLGLAGNTSGVVTIQPAAAAGTWTFTLPTTGGTNNYVLTTNGSGTTTWTDVTTIATGTVTSFSAGNLSPLFTTSVANATTTPALTFSLTNAAGGTVFGNNTSSSAAPAYTSSPVLGIAGTTTGTLGFSGSTSGTVTVQPASAAGTWSLTLPTTGGTSGYFLQTNGSGVTTWAAASGGTTLTRQIITSGSSGTVTGGNYIVTFDPASTLAAYTLTMPASPTDLDIVEVDFGGTLTSGAIVTALTISANSGQTILDNTPPLSATADNTLFYRYRTANTTWYRFKP